MLFRYVFLFSLLSLLGLAPANCAEPAKQAPLNAQVSSYQPHNAAPIQVRYSYPAGSNTQITGIELTLTNLRTRQSVQTPLHPEKQPNQWVVDIPPTAFQQGDPLKMTLTPYGAKNEALTNLAQTIAYPSTHHPEYFSSLSAITNPIQVQVFQKNAASSPAFEVYWPQLTQLKDATYKTAVRIHNHQPNQQGYSIRKMDPIPKRPGWFEFQVPTYWYTPGDEITLEFTTSQATPFDPKSDFPLAYKAPFIPLHSVTYQTLVPEAIESAQSQ